MAAQEKAETSAKRNAPGIGGTCMFSGNPTKTKNALFLPGYDAKFKGLMLKVLRGIEPITKVRKAAIPLLQRPEGLCGFRLSPAGKVTAIGNFHVSDKPKTASKAKAAPAKAAAPAKKAIRRVKVTAPAADSEDEE